MGLRDRLSNSEDEWGVPEIERSIERRAPAAPELPRADRERSPAPADWRGKLWKTSRTVFWNWD